MNEMFDFNDIIMLHTNNKRFISRLSLQDLRSMCHFYVMDNEKYLGYKEVHTEAGWCQVKKNILSGGRHLLSGGRHLISLAAAT